MARKRYRRRSKRIIFRNKKQKGRGILSGLLAQLGLGVGKKKEAGRVRKQKVRKQKGGVLGNFNPAKWF